MARGAAAVLQGHAVDSCGARTLTRNAQVVVDLVHFAAQPEDDGGRHVWMVKHTPQSALQLFGVRPDGVAAAFAVRECHDAIDVGRQGGAGEAFGDADGCVGGAIGGRHHGDVVASAGPAVFSQVTAKCGNVGRGGCGLPLRVGKLVGALALFIGDIVRVDMRSGRNVDGRPADHLPIAEYVLATLDCGQGEFVAGWDRGPAESPPRRQPAHADRPRAPAAQWPRCPLGAGESPAFSAETGGWISTRLMLLLSY